MGFYKKINKILKVFILLSFFFLIRSCDYWSPPIESEMVERGGAYKIWWGDDGSPYYQIMFHQIDTTYTLVLDKADTFILRKPTLDVFLVSLNKNKKRKGFESWWSSPRPKGFHDIELYPFKKSKNSPFGITFDSLGKVIKITLGDSLLFPQLCLYVDSSMNYLITSSDSLSAFGGVYNTYIKPSDTIYPYKKGIAPEPDINNYLTKVLIKDTSAYWLWIDREKNGYSEEDNFVLIYIVSVDTQYKNISLSVYYQRVRGLRWVWKAD